MTGSNRALGGEVDSSGNYIFYMWNSTNLTLDRYRITSSGSLSKSSIPDATISFTSGGQYMQYLGDGYFIKYAIDSTSFSVPYFNIYLYQYSSTFRYIKGGAIQFTYSSEIAFGGAILYGGNLYFVLASAGSRYGAITVEVHRVAVSGSSFSDSIYTQFVASSEGNGYYELISTAIPKTGFVIRVEDRYGNDYQYAHYIGRIGTTMASRSVDLHYDDTSREWDLGSVAYVVDSNKIIMTTSEYHDYADRLSIWDLNTNTITRKMVEFNGRMMRYPSLTNLETGPANGYISFNSTNAYILNDIDDDNITTVLITDDQFFDGKGIRPASSISDSYNPQSFYPLFRNATDWQCGYAVYDYNQSTLSFVVRIQ